jgi:iron complex transport system ATP-binding protein
VGLHNGERIASGPAAEVLTPDNLRIMYGIDAKVSLDAQNRPQILPIRAVE